jgi:hypothetical protein
MKGGDHLEDLGIDGKTLLKLYLKDISWEVLEWIDLALYRDQCLTCELSYKNLSCIKGENFLSS